MKRNNIFSALCALAVCTIPGCTNDDTTDFSAWVNGKTPTASDTIYINYDGATATITGDASGEVSVSGADVTVNSSTADNRVYVLSGSTADGSLLVRRDRMFSIVLNGVSITNLDGPAINNQCGKALYIECAPDTENTLTDGTDYTPKDYDQKGALFSDGQIYFQGAGSLIVTGNYKNAIASDDYITVEKETDIVIRANGTNGMKANDGIFINGGTLDINVTSDGGRGIRSEARTVITGGTINIRTSGDCRIETVDGIRDTTSAAGIKSDSLFVMSAGELVINSSGDGGKGINCSENIEFSGGTLEVNTTGSNDEGKPKAVKSDTGIIVSGGSFKATCKKSWACDNGTDDDDPAGRVTILGTPAVRTLNKRSVVIQY